MRRKASRPALAFVPARYYEILVSFLEERGVARSNVLDGTGVTAELLATEEGYLTLDQVEALVLRASALATGGDIAVDVGRRYQLPSHGALGMAALTAEHVEAALQVAFRFLALVMPFFELEIESDSPRWKVRLRPRWPLDPVVERFHLAALCGSFYAQGTFLLNGPLPPGFELDAKHSRPPNLPDWVNATGVDVRFDRPEYEVRIPAGLAKLPLPLADAKAHAAACRTCEALLAARPDPMRTTSSVRHHLSRSGPPLPDLEGVARALSTSSRTVRRRLSDEGTSFRTVLEGVRIALADEWLARGDRSITEIGLELGYSDAANFTRAYRRARGTTPSDARRARSSGNTRG
jgi:AraC-like DNA-binding protein